MVNMVSDCYCGSCGAPAGAFLDTSKTLVTCVVCHVPLRRESGPLFLDPVDVSDLSAHELKQYIRASGQVQLSKKGEWWK